MRKLYETELERRQARARQKKESREANPKKARAISKRYYAPHKDRLREKQRLRDETNREQKRIKTQQWREEHPEWHRENALRWIKNHLDQHRRSQLQAGAKRRMREKDQFIENIDPKVVYEMHGGMCGICKEFVSKDEFQVDHVIPLAKGGLHGYINVQPAHPVCNARKGARI